MSPDVVDVQHMGGHRLRLTFADGQCLEEDVATMVPWEGVFEPLRDPAYFSRVAVNSDLGTVVWPNGADLCPDVLRANGRIVPPEPASVR